MRRVRIRVWRDIEECDFWWFDRIVLPKYEDEPIDVIRVQRVVIQDFDV